MKETNRTCIITKAEKSKDELLRFTLTPDNQLVPDFKKKLPGKGIYVSNSKSILIQGIAKNIFTKCGKNTKVDASLAEIVENILKNRALESLNLARKAGELVAGFEKVKEKIAKSKVAFLIMAADAGADGRDKMKKAAGGIEILTSFTTEELDETLNKVNTVHVALLKSEIADMAYKQIKKWQDFINS